MSIGVAVIGAEGVMGTHVRDVVVSASDLHLAAAVVEPASPRLGQDAGGTPFAALGPGVLTGAEVAIDFSTPAGLTASLPLLGRMPLVTGTTGLDAPDQELLDAYAREAAVVQAANFSAGVNVLVELVRRAAAALPDADVEVVELHHRRKVDSPSGTALALGRAVQEGRDAQLTAVHGRQGAVGPRGDDELGFHAVRGGDVAGDHTVWLLCQGERVGLQHIASSRETFAAGAVRAARWLVGRPAGHHSMAAVLFGAAG